jgi:RNA polymerase sigma factor (sigma-70 family)
VRTDLELLDAWRAGDGKAGEELVGRYWAGISRFVRQKIGDESADVIAQTFLACVKGRDRIEEGNVKAYVFAIARRRVADHFRVRARRPSEQIDVLQSSLAQLGTGVETALDRKQRGQLLRAGLARIPLDDQIALELAYFEQLSTRELAAVLEIPENTVRSRLSRARAKLRVELAALGLVAGGSVDEGLRGFQLGSDAEEQVLAAVRGDELDADR